MSKPTPAPTPPPDAPITRATINTRRDALVAARDQLRLQLNGVENQIYVLDQLLNPEPEAPAPTPPPPGTI